VVALAIGCVLIVAALLLQFDTKLLVPAAAGVVPADGEQAGRPGGRQPSVPRELSIATATIDAAVVGVTIDAGALQIPKDGDVLGWWRDGAAPGSGRGTAVLAGHVDTLANGPGALYRLETVEPGRDVVVTTDTGPVHYRTVARRAYHKGALPGDLFATTGAPRLAIVTCGGAFDKRTRTYAYNVVVWATPA
jgi:hypothetical protein